MLPLPVFPSVSRIPLILPSCRRLEEEPPPLQSAFLSIGSRFPLPPRESVRVGA